MRPAEIAREIGGSRQNVHRIWSSLRTAPDEAPAAPRRKPMAPEQMVVCMTALGWSNRWLAGYLGRSRATVDRWTNGAAPIPDALADWLELRARQARLYALPDGWILDKG